MMNSLSRAFQAALLGGLILSGCTTVGPNYEVPANAAARRPAAAAQFSAAQEAAFSTAPLPANWWRLYQDEQLDALIEKALRANNDLRVASANLARVRAAQDEAQGAQRPNIGVNASPVYGREAASTLGLPNPLPDEGLYDAGIKVSYQVDLFGKIARGIEAARDDVQAAQAALDLARVSVAADTARAYAEACSAGRELQVAQHSVQLQEEFVRLTERRITVGRGTALDASRARSQLAQLHSSLPPLQARQRIAGYRLAVLTGEVPGAVQPAAGCASELRLSSPIPVGDGAALLRRRPDIRQAERNLAAATARIGVATAELYPSISLGLSAGSVGETAQFAAANTFHWNIGPLISWTLPNNGVARSRIAQAQAGSDAALARFDTSVLNALRETESALTAYARDLDRNAALKTARDQSALAAGQARELFHFGRTDFLTALDAERTLATAESALAASDAQLTTDQVALFLALGGGWEQVPAAGADTVSMSHAAAPGGISRNH